LCREPQGRGSANLSRAGSARAIAPGLRRRKRKTALRGGEGRMILLTPQEPFYGFDRSGGPNGGEASGKDTLGKVCTIRRLQGGMWNTCRCKAFHRSRPPALDPAADFALESASTVEPE